MKVKKSKRSEKSSRENIYSVEKILDKKIKKGKTFYFIKWFNYSDNHNTWEPEENVKISPGLLEEFEHELKENSREGKKVFFFSKFSFHNFVWVFRREKSTEACDWPRR